MTEKYANVPHRIGNIFSLPCTCDGRISQDSKKQDKDSKRWIGFSL